MNTEETISPWVIVLRVIFTLMLIVCIAYIFHNSLEPAVISSGRSQAMMATLNSALGRIHLGPFSEHVVRKLAHFAEYTLEGFWLMLCLRVYTKRFVRHISWPLLGGALTALADETIQLGMAGRSSQVTDVWLDLAGVVAGLSVALVILLIFRGLYAVWSLRRENSRLRDERERLRRQAQQEELLHRQAYRTQTRNTQLTREDLQ